VNGAVIRFAAREWRSGVKGLRILMACLALGVAAIAGTGSLKAAFHAGLARDARAMLGGDLDIRQHYQPLDAAQRAVLESFGRTGQGADLRVMAGFGDERRLAEMKAVDGAYPLVGRLVTEPALPLADILALTDGVHGAAADPQLLAALGAALDDVVQVGETRFQIRALIRAEPDRINTALSFGPRLLVSVEGLQATGLLQPGTLVRWWVRVALDGVDAGTVRQVLAQRFPDAPWQVRDTGEAAPGLERVLDNIAAFLTLVGLTSLLVGGIGVASAVKAAMDARLASIATLKAAGATSGQILGIYGLVVAFVSGLGILAGLTVGALLPWLVAGLAGDVLPVAARTGLYPAPLALAALFGLLTALCFGLAPLAVAAAAPAVTLLRGLAQSRHRPGWRVVLVVATAALGLAVLAVASADRKGLAAVFAVAAPVTLALFLGLAHGLSWLARRASRHRAGPLAHPSVRLALSNLHRPGSTVVSMVISLGLGLTVLVATALVEGNLARQFGERLPAEAPSFFFIDIQPDQVQQFDAAVAGAAPAARVKQAPMVRGRITALNGVRVQDLTVAPEAEWALRGDRGLTASATLPEGSRLAAGSWWAADHAGPPLVSVDRQLAAGLGIGVGDAVTVNVLGREIAARVASLREIEWMSLGMNFAFILSPDALAGAPFTWIATVHAPVDGEDAVERIVTRSFANVSAIRVKEALTSVRTLVARADQAVRLAALVTLAGGALVLAGAVMAGHRRRVREAVLLKVLGATSADLWRAWLVEFGLVGAATGLMAAAIGTPMAWAILVHVMKADWVFLPGLLAATVVVCVAGSLGAGFAGTFSAIRAKSAPLLRGE
jgi:putative ABC transport system permease protein